MVQNRVLVVVVSYQAKLLIRCFNLRYNCHAKLHSRPIRLLWSASAIAAVPIFWGLPRGQDPRNVWHFDSSVTLSLIRDTVVVTPTFGSRYSEFCGPLVMSYPTSRRITVFVMHGPFHHGII
jgi:hypothetical protein